MSEKNHEFREKESKGMLVFDEDGNPFYLTDKGLVVDSKGNPMRTFYVDKEGETIVVRKSVDNLGDKGE